MFKKIAKKFTLTFKKELDTDTLPSRQSDKLIDDFNKRKQEFERANIASSLETLKHYWIQTELKETGLLMTESEAKSLATILFLAMQKEGFITDLGKIKPAGFEVITDSLIGG